MRRPKPTKTDTTVEKGAAQVATTDAATNVPIVHTLSLYDDDTDHELNEADARRLVRLVLAPKRKIPFPEDRDITGLHNKRKRAKLDEDDHVHSRLKRRMVVGTGAFKPDYDVIISWF